MGRSALFEGFRLTRECSFSPILPAIPVAYSSSLFIAEQIAANLKHLLKVLFAIYIVGATTTAHGCRESVSTVCGGAERYSKNCAKHAGSLHIAYDSRRWVGSSLRKAVNSFNIEDGWKQLTCSAITIPFMKVVFYDSGCLTII